MRQEWRCVDCNKLLGVLAGGRLHIRIGKGHEYLVGFPVTVSCQNCHSLNELRDPGRKEVSAESEQR